jgi:hypothetical protein
MTSNTDKLLAGALLAGMGIITGQATLVATAADVGVNWLAEGLAGLWPASAGRPDDPLAKAYAAAIRDAVDRLETDYTRTVDPRADRAPFRLVAACSAQVAAAEFPATVSSVDTAQTALDASLAALLHGHDPRQVDFLRSRLLQASASAFQRRLVQDEAAWRAFHGLLLQSLARHSAELFGRMERFGEVLAAWSDPTASLASLRAIKAKLDDLAQQPAAASRSLFDNRGMRVGGSVYQATGDQTIASAHATGGGTASVVNILGRAPAPAAQPPAPPPVALLFLAANPLGTQRLRVDQEARRVDQALRLARHADRFQLAQQWAVRSDELLDALLRRRPALVHFAGHGDQAGQLILEDAAGRAAPVQPGALAALVAAADTVRCAVLNACWSDALADALLRVLPCVVGMTGEVEDAAAIAFAAGFYRALADGESVAAAVDAGAAQARAEGHAGDDLLAPRLRAAEGVDPSAMRFV